MPLGDTTHEMFWQQLLRWLVADTPGHVVASVPNRMLFDDGRVQFSADVRDKSISPRRMRKSKRTSSGRAASQPRSK